MVFSYKTYWNNTFVFPIIIIFFMVIILISSSYEYWNKLATQTHTMSKTIKYIFCILITFMLISPQCKYLLNGGVYLLIEDEEDALIHTGRIESICEPSNRFPRFKSHHRFGADIVIDGEQYFVITCCDFSEGENVTIYYLPNSRFILSIIPYGTEDGTVGQGTVLCPGLKRELLPYELGQKCPNSLYSGVFRPHSKQR